MPDPVAKSQAAVKDLLLEDFRHLAESLWKSEEAGETRVNWFIGVVTAVAAGLVTLASAKDRPHGELLRLIVIGALSAVLVLGLTTLARIVMRNQTTDRLKEALDKIREIFRDHFGGKEILEDYEPFARGRRVHRRFGGLAHIVIGINSLVASALVVACSLPRGQVLPGLASSHLFCVYAGAAVAFMAAAGLQGWWLYWREKRAAEKSTS